MGQTTGHVHTALAHPKDDQKTRFRDIAAQMYQIIAHSDHENRFVIPTIHREQVEVAYDIRGGCSFPDDTVCATGTSSGSPFRGAKKPLKTPRELR